MPGIKDLNHLSQAELSYLWECSTRTIQRKPELESLRHGSGQGCYYVWSECHAHEKAQMSQDQEGEISHADRLKKAQADNAELDLAVKLGRLLVAEDVESAYSKALASMRARLLSIPASAGLRIDPSHTQAQREEIIRKDIHEALEALVGLTGGSHD